MAKHSATDIHGQGALLRMHDPQTFAGRNIGVNRFHPDTFVFATECAYHRSQSNKFKLVLEFLVDHVAAMMDAWCAEAKWVHGQDASYAITKRKAQNNIDLLDEAVQTLSRTLGDLAGKGRVLIPSERSADSSEGDGESDEDD